MTTATPAAPPAPAFDRAALERLVAACPLPGWATEARREALVALERLALPDRRSENWMRTDLRLFRPQAWGPRDTTGGVAPEGLLAAAIAAGAGQDEEQSRVAGTLAGLRCCSHLAVPRDAVVLMS